MFRRRLVRFCEKRYKSSVKSSERVFVQIEENWISPARKMKRFVLRDGVAKTTVSIAPKEREYADSSPSTYFAPRFREICGSNITGLVDRALVHLLPKDFSKS